MNQLQFVLLLFATYSGMLAGIIISHMSKEELNVGKKYFLAAKAIVFSFLTYTFFIYLIKDQFLSIGISFFGAIFCYLLERWLKFFNADLFFYSFFAVIVYEARDSQHATLLWSFVFLFGILTASIKSEKIKDANLFTKIKEIFPGNIIYLILGILLSFVFKT